MRRFFLNDELAILRWRRPLFQQRVTRHAQPVQWAVVPGSTLAYDSAPRARVSAWVKAMTLISWTTSLILVGYITMLIQGGSRIVELCSRMPVDAMSVYTYGTFNSAVAAIVSALAAVAMTPAGRRSQHLPMVVLSIGLIGAYVLQAFPVPHLMETL